LSSLVSLLVLSVAGVAHAGSSCVAFDIHWNLLALGFNGKDYSAGTQDKWASGTATDITATSGRPPFDGPNVNCYLSQYTNAIYVLGADKTNPSSIYIYDATAKSWSTQAVDTQGFNPSSFSAILDHDTNVFYALSGTGIYFLDMKQSKADTSTAITWTKAVDNAGFGADYKPVMALAQNHIHFLDVPGVPAGSAKIFVIHYSYLQPQPQSYGYFPAVHGQATSFFRERGVQEEFAFIPDNGAATYVINVQSNTTRALAGPNVKDSSATYFASESALVQLTASGQVNYLPYDGSAKAGTWSPVKALSAPSPRNVKRATDADSSSPNAALLTSVSGWSVKGIVVLCALALGSLL